MWASWEPQECQESNYSRQVGRQTVRQGSSASCSPSSSSTTGPTREKEATMSSWQVQTKQGPWKLCAVPLISLWGLLTQSPKAVCWLWTRSIKRRWDWLIHDWRHFRHFKCTIQCPIQLFSRTLALYKTYP
jgi:hypothetical protein